MMWRNRTHARGGMARFESAFCSQACNCAVQAKARTTRVMVKCGWHECKTEVPRKCSELKSFKNAYCRRDHYYLALRKQAHDAKQADQSPDGRALYFCEKCKDVTEHRQKVSMNNGCKQRLKCLTCGTHVAALTAETKV